MRCWGRAAGAKTTLLRLIGGFLRPSAGRVYLHGADVSHLPPNRRPTSMVFQNYALFPHMTVERNVAYGLKLLKVPAGDIRDRVDRMLSMVGLEGYNRRMPHELSGGQQQRVQLARSLVLERDILLLDEPLASLDAKLRKDMCLELKRIQEKVGITFIHVTHNQEEALTVADRIAIIADGELVEEGTARDVYETPDKRFHRRVHRRQQCAGRHRCGHLGRPDCARHRLCEGRGPRAGRPRLDRRARGLLDPLRAAAPGRSRRGHGRRLADRARKLCRRRLSGPYRLASRPAARRDGGRRARRVGRRRRGRIRTGPGGGRRVAHRPGPACTLPDAAVSSKPNRRCLRRSRSSPLRRSR